MDALTYPSPLNAMSGLPGHFAAVHADAIAVANFLPRWDGRGCRFARGLPPMPTSGPVPGSVHRHEQVVRPKGRERRPERERSSGSSNRNASHENLRSFRGFTFPDAARRCQTAILNKRILFLASVPLTRQVGRFPCRESRPTRALRARRRVTRRASALYRAAFVPCQIVAPSSCPLPSALHGPGDEAPTSAPSPRVTRNAGDALAGGGTRSFEDDPTIASRNRLRIHRPAR